MFLIIEDNTKIFLLSITYQPTQEISIGNFELDRWPTLGIDNGPNPFDIVPVFRFICSVQSLISSRDVKIAQII